MARPLPRPAQTITVDFYNHGLAGLSSLTIPGSTLPGQVVLERAPGLDQRQHQQLLQRVGPGETTTLRECTALRGPEGRAAGMNYRTSGR